MSGSFQPVPLTFSKGFDRSVTPFKADLQSCYELLNLRPSRNEIGVLEQTPYFYSSSYSAGTYWNGSTSVTEDSTTAIYGGWYNRVNGLNTLFTSFTARENGTQIPIFYQTTNTTTQTVNTGCLLDITSVTTLAVNLGSSVDVEMTGAAAFRWRKNGGAWTPGIPSTTGVSIGGATIYFLASSGFAGTETWTWTRTDCTLSPVNSTTGLLNGYSWFSSLENGKNILIWLSNDNRVMITKYDSSGVDPVARSLGYWPIVGTGLTILDAHLFVCDATFGTTLVLYTGVVKNSDLTDIENFISTDINEADSHSFPDTIQGTSAKGVSVNQQIFTIGERVFVLSGTKVYSSSYLGLPTVFSFVETANFAYPQNTCSRSRVVQTSLGVYIVREDGAWFFDGASFSWVGRATQFEPTNISTTSIFLVLDIAFDHAHKELVLLARYGAGGFSDAYVFVFQERTQTWCRRGCYFNTPAAALFYLSGTVLTLGATSLKYFREDSSWTQTPIGDSATGSAFTLPTVTTQLISHGLISSVKESESAYLLAQALSVSDISSGYLQTTHTIVKLYWHVSTDGTIGTMSTSANSKWLSTSIDGLISFPRLSFRLVAFQLVVTTDNTAKPPAGVRIIQLEPRITAPANLPSR